MSPIKYLIGMMRLRGYPHRMVALKSVASNKIKPLDELYGVNEYVHEKTFVSRVCLIMFLKY